ncbi:MAG TPA: hypothetical protein VF463_08415 [Sphingobium sp.]
MTTWAEAADQMIAVVSRLATFQGELQAWTSGTITGGPNGDGAYPFTQPDGIVTLIPCPAKLSAQLAGKYDGLFADGVAQQAEVRTWLTASDAAFDQIRAWLTGVRFGGTFADGRYPVTLSSGTTVYVACPDRIQMLAVAAVDPADLDDAVWEQIENAQAAAASAIAAAAAAQGLRLTFGERLPGARVQSQVFNGATLITSGGRNIGYTIPAGQTGRSSYARADILLTAKQAAFLAGMTVRLRAVAQVTVGFLTANTLLGTAAQATYVDSTFGTVGGVDRSEQVGGLLYREVLVNITADMRRIGVPLQITGTALARDVDHSLTLSSTTIVVDTLPGAQQGGTDVAFQFRLDERLDPVDSHLLELDQAFIGLGDQLDIAQPAVGVANGSTISGYTLSFPAGVTGQYSLVGAGIAFNGAQNVGRKLRIKLAYEVSAPFTRLGSYTPFVQTNLAGGGFENRAPFATRDETINGERVLTLDYLVRGDETAIRPFPQLTGATVTAAAEFMRLKGFSLAYLSSPSSHLTAADDALRYFRDTLGNYIHFGTGMALADASTAQVSAANGAVVALDGNGQRVGWTIPAGQAGNSSQFYAQVSVDGARNVGNRVRIIIPFDVSATFTRDNLFRVMHVRTAGGFVQRDVAVNRFITTAAGKRQWIIEYVMQGDELAIRPGMVQSTTAPTASDEYLRATDFVLEWISNTKPYKSVMDVNMEAGLARLRADAAADAASLLSGGAAVVRTLKPSGGDYSSIAAAVAALNNGTAASRYRLKVSEGIYTDVEWRPQDYLDIVGYDRDRTVFAGSLPNNASAAQITNTSAMWQEKSSRLEGITVTMKNGRYAIHLESNGFYPNRLLEHINCHVEHFGNAEAVNSAWGSTFGVGAGLSSGVTVVGRGTLYKGPAGGFSYHTNIDWADPSFVDLEGCELIGVNDTAFSMRILPIGSGVADKCRLVGNKLMGDIVYGPSPWLQTTLARQPADHSEVAVWGHSNTPAVFRSIDFGLALVIASDTTGAASSIAVGGTAAPWLFGDGAALKLDTNYSRAGSPGFRGRAVGWGDISGTGVGPTSDLVITRLGQRLGNCTTTSKTLTVAVNGGAAQSVIFNEDFTAQPNSYVLAFINARVAGATASTLATGALYRPRFTDEEAEVLNNTASGLFRGSVLAFDGSSSRVRAMTAADSARLYAGVAMYDVEAGKTGRVKTRGFMAISDVLRDDGADFAMGDTFSIGSPGRIVKGGAQGLLMAVRNTALKVN